MDKYYMQHPAYVQSELKTADKYLLNCILDQKHQVVTANWIWGFHEWLIDKQEAYIAAHRNVKRVEITAPAAHWVRGKSLYFRVGAISLTFEYVQGEHDYFQVPMFDANPVKKSD